MKEIVNKITQGATRLLVFALGLGLVSNAWGSVAVGDPLTFSSIGEVGSATAKDGASGCAGFTVTITKSLALP